MSGKEIRIPATGGGEFDCYLATPVDGAKVPAVVIASAIHGVDHDIRALADEFAGIGCHSTQMMDYTGELEGVAKPVCLLWGDQDVMAPAELQTAYREIAGRKKNLELHIFPGILHGYMMPAHKEAFDAQKREFSMSRARAMLEGLRAPN